jgi:hypothetical protein
MESLEQEDGRRRRRSYDEAFKHDAVRLASAEKHSFKGGQRLRRAIKSRLPSARISRITAFEAASTRVTFREAFLLMAGFHQVDLRTSTLSHPQRHYSWRRRQIARTLSFYENSCIIGKSDLT